MGGGIYLIQDDDRLVEMTEQAYDSEDRLQELLEKYPNLLAGDQIDRATPRRWLLIAREVAIPEEEGNGKWSLDHLFLDQNAIPTLVEVKSSNDSRSRREVIGQMLDYAANVVVYWPVESIVVQFESNCRDQGRDPEQIFEEFLGSDADEELFWQKVKTNLQAGKVRLAFVTDDISAELQRVVEFLNEQMDPTEVLAVEIKQYVSENGLKTLVPRIIGQTAEAQHKKSSATRERRRWDEVSFFQEFAARQGRDEAKIAKKIYEWAREQEPDVHVQWGTGDTYGGFAAKLKHKGMLLPELFTVDISGQLEISSSNYASQRPFNSEVKWLELRNQLSSIGLSLPADPTERRLPSLRLSTLQDEMTLQQVMATFEWIVDQIIP
ncbi:hypothetical protein [Microcoleus sp. FACHB-672]|uniref:hypothetical protein n=1 Tax=Microcoleus sp. FACHB-672 TaxID=2692825 RepID=UPI00168262EF|nr:hypothetical protein [Microcoleus sp. FACHB-672]MBD2041779.1 hypothetical protein [Microcoleus sp. FACHB-672]